MAGALCGVPPLSISIVGVPVPVTRITFRYCGITGLVSKPDRSRLIVPNPPIPRQRSAFSECPTIHPVATVDAAPSERSRFAADAYA
ncbi:MAG: hypothetical protein QOJ99_2818 [Bryobacterales bacterium]|nr:hypothetical protein [Bryobacterales bacterium]